MRRGIFGRCCPEHAGRVGSRWRWSFGHEGRLGPTGDWRPSLDSSYRLVEAHRDLDGRHWGAARRRPVKGGLSSRDVLLAGPADDGVVVAERGSAAVRRALCGTSGFRHTPALILRVAEPVDAAAIVIAVAQRLDVSPETLVQLYCISTQTSTRPLASPTFPLTAPGE
jgi:hypothetical protein